MKLEFSIPVQCSNFRHPLFLVTPAEFEYLVKLKQVLEMPWIEVTTVIVSIKNFGVQKKMCNVHRKQTHGHIMGEVSGFRHSLDLQSTTTCKTKSTHPSHSFNKSSINHIPSNKQLTDQILAKLCLVCQHLRVQREEHFTYIPYNVRNLSTMQQLQ